MIKMIKTWNIVHLWSRPDAVLLLFFFSSSLKNDPEAGCDDLLKRTRNIFLMIMINLTLEKERRLTCIV